MRVIEVADPAEAATYAADLVEECAPQVLGAATGTTPEPLYRALVARRAPTSVTTVCLLDEYIGLPMGHPQRYRHVIDGQLAAPLGLKVLAPDVDADDARAACARYEAALDELGGVDLQILGIGRNGHVGFNEPGTSFDSVTHVVELTATTRIDNARFFDDPTCVPSHAITQGIATITRAKRIVLLATGSAKASAVGALLDGPVTTSHPASALRNHHDIVLIADRAALGQPSNTPSHISGAA